MQETLGSCKAEPKQERNDERMARAARRAQLIERSLGTLSKSWK